MPNNTPPADIQQLQQGISSFLIQWMVKSPDPLEALNWARSLCDSLEAGHLAQKENNSND